MGDPVIRNEKPGCPAPPSGKECFPLAGIGKTKKKGNECEKGQYPHIGTREGKYKKDRGCEYPQEKTRLHRSSFSVSETFATLQKFVGSPGIAMTL